MKWDGIGMTRAGFLSRHMALHPAQNNQGTSVRPNNAGIVHDTRPPIRRCSSFTRFRMNAFLIQPKYSVQNTMQCNLATKVITRRGNTNIKNIKWSESRSWQRYSASRLFVACGIWPSVYFCPRASPGPATFAVLPFALVISVAV